MLLVIGFNQCKSRNNNNDVTHVSVFFNNIIFLNYGEYYGYSVRYFFGSSMKSYMSYCSSVIATPFFIM
jgi:hypothetical protein